MSGRKAASGIKRKLFGRKLSVVITSLAVAALSAAAISAKSWLPLVQGAEEVRTILRQEGFDPPEVTRGAGRVRLTVVNQSGKENLTYRLVGPGGEELHRSQPTTGTAEWSEEFDLTPGQYVLTEADNPAWLFYVNAQ